MNCEIVEYKVIPYWLNAADRRFCIYILFQTTPEHSAGIRGLAGPMRPLSGYL